MFWVWVRLAKRSGLLDVDNEWSGVMWCSTKARQKADAMIEIHILGGDQEPFGSIPFDQILYCMYLRPDRIQFVLQTDFLYLAAFSRFIHLCFTDSSIIVCSTWLSFMSLSYLFIGIIYTVQFCLTQRFTKTKRYFKQLPDSGSQMVTFRKFNLPWYVIYKLPNTVYYQIATIGCSHW
mgnify:CR=1 FL=1